MLISTLSGFGSTALHDRADVVGLANARREQDVRARFGVGGEAGDRLAERVGVADEEALGAGGQERAAAGLVDRGAGGANTVDRLIAAVQRLCAVRILDREPGDAGFHAAPDVLSHSVAAVRVARLEVGAHRQAGGRDDLADVVENLFDLERVERVGTAAREREPGARRGEGLEAERFERAGAARIPGVGDDEAAGLVQGAEARGQLSLPWRLRVVRHRQTLTSAAQRLDISSMQTAAARTSESSCPGAISIP